MASTAVVAAPLHGDGGASDAGDSDAAKTMPSAAQSEASCFTGDLHESGQDIFIKPVLTTANLRDVTDGEW